ncbi:hypothetical protein MN116_008588 [Schistosoma mekongi]|uniref:Organic anion transporter n=1 Tax=Schistosoma mekongi TaxID=38744 RepID=A0AAE1Z6A6_SCHME|nr:hypothetical protein MN116_008588 [Schistosoma mekongi]
MPTPHLSRATSGPSSGYAVGDEICDTSCPIDWDTNVVNFISTCLHPGLVRRTSSSATYGFDKPHHFVRQHRRNLSTATTVGFSRHLDNHISSSRVPYSNIPNHPNDNQAPSLYYSRRVLGHARNISDPTSGWDFRIVTKPLILDQLTERPSYNWDGSVEQNPVISSEHHKIPDVLFIPEAKNETYPCMAPHPPCDITLEKSLVCPRDSDTHEITTAVNDDDSSCLCPCLQTCANPYVVLMGLCLTMFMQTMVVSGLMSSMFTTLERRFNLSSRQIGYMISCYEVAGVITTVIVSFISGKKHNRLRVIGLATLILALGFGLFALPHFLAGPYRPNLSTVTSGNNGSRISTEDTLLDSSLPSSTFSLNQDLENSVQLDGPVCIDQSRNAFVQNAIPTSLSDQTNVDGEIIRAASLTTTDNNDIHEPSSTGFFGSNDIVQSVLFPTFCVAMLLAGIGASPLYVLAPTYLWDNLTDRQYPIYAALFYSAGGLGPACGFLAGAGFLSVYIDSPFMLPETGLDRNSPLWLGAWWLGILVCAALTFLVALPVICMPKRLIINKNDSDTISNETAGDDNKITFPATIQNNSHNISYSTNLNSNNVNLSYVKSSDNLSNTNIKQSGQLQPPLKSTVVTSAAVSSVVKTQIASETINPSPGSHKIQYPSLKEFKQQQQQQIPEMKECNVDLHKTPSLRSSTNFTTYHDSHSKDDDNRSTITPLNSHFHSHLDTTDHNDSVGLNIDGQTTNNLGRSLRTSLHNSFCESKNNLKSKIKASYLILRRVLTNPIWLGVTVSTVVEQSIVSAFLTFAAKYIQILFHIPAYLASIHTGAVIVPSSLLGVLSGALLMRHFRPTLHRTLSGLCIMIALTVITSISLMSIGCHSSRVAGITATYSGENWPWKNGPGFLIPPNLTAPCNQYCYSSMDRLRKVGSRHTQYSESQCSVRHYNPVCWTGIINKKIKDNQSVTCATDVANSDNLDNFGDNGCNIESLTFFNPCFAGCRTRVLEAGVIKKYSDCQCVTPYALNPSGSISSLASSSPTSPSIIGTISNDELLLMANSGEVFPGRCKPKCALYGLFLAMLFLHILCTGILQNPSNVITLSCVSSEDGSVALGLQIFFVRTLAYIPAPIYFGQLFDLACQYRTNTKNHYSNIPSSPSAVVVNGNESSSMNSNASIVSSLPTMLSTQNSSLFVPSTYASSLLSASPDEHSATSGGCLEYNLEGLPFIWLGIVCALKVISLIGSTITWWLAKRQFDLIAKHKAKHHHQQQEQSHDQEDKKLEMNTTLPSNTISDPVNLINNNSSQFIETTLSQSNC